MQNKIIFKTLTELKSFCKRGKIIPELYISSDKHSNMRGEFKHQISGQLKSHQTEFFFTVKEQLILKYRTNFIDFTKI